MALSCIVFDCDGVIIESVDAKTAAFAKIADELAPAETAAFVDYVVLHGGVSRFEKFAWLIRRAFNRDMTDEESQILGKKFRQYCLDAVIAAPLVPGFVDVVKQWYGRIPLYVASGAPHYELVEVLRQKGLADYFKGIYGTPPAKALLLLTALRDCGVSPAETVMVGDSKTDSDAAVIVGTLFYGRGEYFKNKPWLWAEDLTHLNEYLDRVAVSDT
jgi:Predicted phosphatases